MSGHGGDTGSTMIDTAWDRPGPDGADLRPRGDLTAEGHVHPWPLDDASWRELACCELCGLTMLRLIVNSSDWVVRRVEHVAFLDECTVRRRVSIDYVAPEDAVTFCRPSGQQVRILPMAILRRKSLVKFDFRDHDGHALPLLGLRQNQALTLASLRAWAAAGLHEAEPGQVIEPETSDFLDDVIAGDQIELWRAFKRMWEAKKDDEQLKRLGKDKCFRAVLDRFADSFVLYGLHDAPFGERRLIKFSYDEPLTLRFSKSSYQPHGKDGKGGREKYEDTEYTMWSWTALRSAVGFTPTRIKFPVPAAELAASFHFEISAPPEVSIVNAALLAGRPSPEPKEPEPAPAATMKDRERRRPSFDAISGGYPTVDLHVADVPYGSRSRAQVEVEARVTGWFGTAVFASWLASAILLFSYLARPQAAVGSTLLASFAAGLAVMLVRQDPHRLVTRLLSKVRQLATFAAVLALAAAVVMASNNPARVQGWLLGLFLASLVPTTLISVSCLLALRRSQWAKIKESPWELHRPRRSKLESADPELPAQLKDKNRHETLARIMEDEEYPYDWAHHELKFDEPAIRVASSEGDRIRYLWDKSFARAFQHRLDAYRKAVTSRDSAGC
jgi:hypothetical protein